VNVSVSPPVTSFIVPLAFEEQEAVATRSANVNRCNLARCLPRRLGAN
jgi:hypothetical protein